MLLKNQFNKALLLAILSVLCLSTGLIINSMLAWKGNSWAWTASLRFLLLIPVLIIVVASRKGWATFLVAFKKMMIPFIVWGSLGFGIYYALLSYAVQFAPGWLVTATFMTTVLAGLLVSPFIYKDHRSKISAKHLTLSLVLVVGLFVMQMDHLASLKHSSVYLASIVMALIAAFLWPLGNRKVMLELENADIHLDPFQRVLGMTLGSLPVLIALALYGCLSSGAPNQLQLTSSFIAVLISGVLGFTLYFKATQIVKSNPTALATIEATQVISVVFTLLGEMLIKNVRWPGIYSDLGLLLLLAGLFCYYFLSRRDIDSAAKQTF